MTILVLSPMVPQFDRASGWLRLYHLLKLLAASHKVILCADQIHRVYGVPQERYLAEMRRLGIETHLFDFDLDRLIKRHRVTHVLFEFFFMFERYGSIVRSADQNICMIVDSVDVHFAREMQMADVAGSRALAAAARRTRRRELRVYRGADLVLAVTPKDRDILIQEDAAIPVDVVPNIHEVPLLNGAIPRDRDHLLFVGGFKHPPNADAVVHFVREVFPLIKARVPAARLSVVGEDPPAEVLGLQNGDVAVLGHVPDLGPLLRSATVSVAPLRFGGGLKGKVGEAMAYGLPVVTTPVGVQGMDLAHGRELMIGDGPQAFADAVVRLCQDHGFAAKMAEDARSYVRRHYTPDAVRDRLIAALAACRIQKPRLAWGDRAFFYLRARAGLALKRVMVWRVARSTRSVGALDVSLRYLPIVAKIAARGFHNASVLEVGSGSKGIGPFIGRRFVGVDASLVSPFSPHLVPVLAHGDCLPFCDRSFDVTINIDMLEHVPVQRRQGVIGELLRVSRRGAFLAVPCDSLAEQQDRELDARYLAHFGTRYPFLVEHVNNGLPTREGVLADLAHAIELDGRKARVTVVPNVNLTLRQAYMSVWTSRYKPIRLMYWLLSPFHRLWPLMSWGACYRQIFFIDIEER
jgi:glycosyltransferase involved in cell wall biosynthesis/SAM-dependent methyltransferase